MGFAGVVCYSNVAYMSDLWGPNIIFFHGVQNLWRRPCLGGANILLILQQIFYWPQMERDVSAWTTSCKQCVRRCDG